MKASEAKKLCRAIKGGFLPTPQPGSESFFPEILCQNGVAPGPVKLNQFRAACSLRSVPALYAQGSKGDEAIAHVKLFNPVGSGSWFIMEWNPDTSEAYGYVMGLGEDEYGYIPLNQLADISGVLGIGLEIDVHFTPARLGDIKKGKVQ